MRALWLEKRALSVRQIASPEPAPGEALVRVLVAGICNTDIELTRGYYPFTGVPGHEFVGEWNGRRVVGEINAVCGRCEACSNGRRSHCENRTVLGIKGRNGAFAEYLTLPIANLHSVPEGISNEEAIFTEPLAAALEIQEQVAITPGMRVLVVGYGKLGRLVARTLEMTGCTLAIAGRDDKVSGTYDVVVECSGTAEGFAVARRAVRPRGTLVVKSTYAGDLTLNMSSLVVDEITLIGSRCGPFEKALRLLQERKIDVRPLLDAILPLGDAIEAFRRAEQPGTLKVALQCR